jgi:hypothetical protein
MRKANGKTTTLLPLQDSLYPTLRKREDTGNWKRRYASFVVQNYEGAAVGYAKSTEAGT